MKKPSDRDKTELADLTKTINRKEVVRKFNTLTINEMVILCTSMKAAKSRF